MKLPSIRSPLTVLILAGTVGLLGVVAMPISGAIETRSATFHTQSSLEQIQQELVVRSQTDAFDVNGRGFPRTIDPVWFDERPENFSATLGRPWIDIAGEDEADLIHPSVPIAHDGMASFWYNPALGIVRARVPKHTTDRAAHALYCDINDVPESSIPLLSFAR